MSKFTPWFPPAQRRGENPHRKGVFQTAASKRPSRVFYRYWDGRRWGDCATTPEAAVVRRKKANAGFPCFWRGLAKRPA